MDIASIALHFLCAAVAGFLIMSIFGVQALVALCSSISLEDVRGLLPVRGRARRGR